jgi:glutamate racemase
MRAVHCHGLAGAIERDPESAAVTALIASCAARVRAADPGGVPLFAGLCCTHYGYIADRFCTALGAALGRPVQALNPNARMVDDLALDAQARSDSGEVSVHVLSKVALDDTARQAIARLVTPISPATAQALLSYSHVPDLF